MISTTLLTFCHIALITSSLMRLRVGVLTFLGGLWTSWAVCRGLEAVLGSLGAIWGCILGNLRAVLGGLGAVLSDLGPSGGGLERLWRGYL